MKALKIFLLVAAPFGILCGIMDIGLAIFVSPFNAGYAALGLVLILINSFGLALALAL